jgi:hypothetical protein
MSEVPLHQKPTFHTFPNLGASRSGFQLSSTLQVALLHPDLRLADHPPLADPLFSYS